MGEHPCVTACAWVSGITGFRLSGLLLVTDAPWCFVTSNLSSKLDTISQCFLSYKIELMSLHVLGLTV